MRSDHMAHHTTRRSRVLLVAASLVLLACGGCNRSAPAPTASQSGAPCLGCSTDGKTTPRSADGHPDLSGYWSGAAPNPDAAARGGVTPAATEGATRGNRGRGAGFGFAGGVMQRYADGSIVYDP